MWYTVYTMVSRLILSICLLASFFPHMAYAREYVGGELIKIAGSDAVYYVGTDLKRYVFSGERVYKTWYENFNAVTQVSVEELTGMSLAGVVRYRPGSRMIKIPDDPKVYVVATNGLVRHIANEAVASGLYGTEWNKKIDDLEASLLVSNYTFGTVISRVSDIDLSALATAASSISVDRALPILVLPPTDSGSTTAPATSTPAAPEPPKPVTLGALEDIEFALSDSNTMYIASADANVGAWKSNNSGTTWSRIYTGGGLKALAVHTTNSNLVLLSDSGKIKRSVNGGVTWFSVTSTPANLDAVVALSFATVTPDLVYGISEKLLIKSQDAGLTWTTVSGVNALTWVFTDVLRVHPQNDELIFTGSTKGLQHSSNGGTAWRESTSSTKYSNPTNAEFLKVRSIDFDNRNAFVYYMTTDQGLWYTADNASSWNTNRIPDVADNELYDFEVGDTDSNIVHVATKKGIFRSINRAQSWESVNTGLPLTDLLSLAVDPKDENVVLIGTRDQGVNEAAGEGLYKTTDAGLMWKKQEAFEKK